MTGAPGAPGALAARFLALDRAVQARAGSFGERLALGALPLAAGPFRAGHVERLRRAAFVLALVPPFAGLTDGGGIGARPVDPLDPHLEPPRQLVERWRALALALRARATGWARLGGDGWLVAAALGLLADLRAATYGDALAECLERWREVRLGGPPRAAVIAAALLVTEGARHGSGIVPSFERLRAVAALRREVRESGRAWGDARDLCAAAVGPPDPSEPAPDGVPHGGPDGRPGEQRSAGRAAAVALAGLSPAPAPALAAELAAHLAALEAAPALGAARAALAARCAAAVAVQAA